MFSFFKKQKVKNVELFSPTNGELLQITKVEDQVFSEKMMGDGFAIKPSIEQIYSPIKGKVISVFPTKHAIGLETESGLEVLVHMGINTVELKGEPFEIFVKIGDQVDQFKKIARMDLKYLNEKNVENDIIVVFTNLKDTDKFQLENEKMVNQGELVGSID